MHFSASLSDGGWVQKRLIESGGARQPPWKPYGHEIDRAYRVGDEIPISCARRRREAEMSGTADPDMRRRRRADIERGGEQGSRPHAPGVSADAVDQRSGQAAERANIQAVTKGISAFGETVLGAAFLGCRVRGMEYRERDGGARAGIFGTPP